MLMAAYGKLGFGTGIEELVLCALAPLREDVLQDLKNQTISRQAAKAQRRNTIYE
jgi:hypothetical protein